MRQARQAINGEALKKARAQAELVQLEVCAMAGISSHTYTLAERYGIASAEVLGRIAKVLRVSPQALEAR